MILPARRHFAPNQAGSAFSLAPAVRCFSWVALLLLGMVAMPGWAQDTTPPVATGVSSSTGNEVGVCFSEEMDLGSVSEPLNYLIEDSEGLKAFTGVLVQPGNQGVVLQLSQPVVGEIVVTLGFLFDKAGNLLEPGAQVTGRVWQARMDLRDVGAPTSTGTVFSCVEGQVTLSGEGDFLNVRSDTTSFLSVERTNDFDVRVRLDDLAGVASPYSGAGLMVRETLQPGSIHRTVLATATNGVNRLYVVARAVTDTLSSHIENGPTVDSYPIWLRLKRTGTRIIAFASRDGATWLQTGTAFDLPQLPARANVGLVAGSSTPGAALRAAWRDFGETLLFPAATAIIRESPHNASVEVHQSARFIVSAEAPGAAADALSYQWQMETSPGSGEFTNVFFATRSTFSTGILSESDNGLHFRVVVRLAGHAPLLSAPALLTVSPDRSGPRILSATGTRRMREIVLAFDEPLERGGASAPHNYTVSGLTVTNVLVDPGGTFVLLTLAEVQAPGASNTVTMSNLTDLAGHALATTTIVAQPVPLAAGYAIRELYYGVPGFSVLALRLSPFFPSFPNELRYVTQLEGPNDILAENGTRLSGFLLPPVSGNYHFWMCSDDQGEFRLSTDMDPSHMQLLCNEPENNFYRDYLGTTRRNPTAPENRSQTRFPSGIPLEAGKAYYFEALSKNGFIYGNLSVTWQIPGGPAPTNGAAPIPGAYLSTFVDPTFVTLSLRQNPSEQNYSFPEPSENSGLLRDERFTASDGAFTAQSIGDPTGAWTYSPENGNWFANGSGSTMIPSDKTLTSPPLRVTRTGHVEVTFEHRYSFEFDGALGWDGGQLRVSTNGGPFGPVLGSALVTNGYVRAIAGLGALLGQEGFNGESLGYVNGVNLTSIARLGYFRSNDLIRLQFVGAWDELNTGTSPNWLIDRVRFVEGLPGGPAVTFSVAAEGAIEYAPNQPIAYQWQRDCGTGFTDVRGATNAIVSFAPLAADAGCRFRCQVELPGLRLTSEAATLKTPSPRLEIRREAGLSIVLTWTETGHLQEAESPFGPWTDVPGATGNTAFRPIVAQPRFYRVSVP